MRASDLGEWLRRDNGDLSPLKDLARRAPASARRPLKGLKFALPVARPGKIVCLGQNYLEHVKEGRRDNRFEISHDLHALLVYLDAGARLEPMIRSLVSETLDWEAEMVVVVVKRCLVFHVGNS